MPAGEVKPKGGKSVEDYKPDRAEVLTRALAAGMEREDASGKPIPFDEGVAIVLDAQDEIAAEAAAADAKRDAAGRAAYEQGYEQGLRQRIEKERANGGKPAWQIALDGMVETLMGQGLTRAEAEKQAMAAYKPWELRGEAWAEEIPYLKTLIVGVPGLERISPVREGKDPWTGTKLNYRRPSELKVWASKGNAQKRKELADSIKANGKAAKKAGTDVATASIQGKAAAAASELAKDAVVIQFSALAQQAAASIGFWTRIYEMSQDCLAWKESELTKGDRAKVPSWFLSDIKRAEQAEKDFQKGLAGGVPQGGDMFVMTPDPGKKNKPAGNTSLWTSPGGTTLPAKSVGEWFAKLSADRRAEERAALERIHDPRKRLEAEADLKILEARYPVLASLELLEAAS
jgi:hypothetical protein